MFPGYSMVSVYISETEFLAPLNNDKWNQNGTDKFCENQTSYEKSSSFTLTEEVC